MKVGNDPFPAFIMLYGACSTMILSMGTPQSLLKAYRLSTLVLPVVDRLRMFES